ncbi:MAG: hypothetical protein ACR2JH_02425 [Solirubrobacteraceae bacterium]
MNSHEVSRQQEIASVFSTKPHVVILGAGASIAALSAGDRNAKQLPDMHGLASVPAVRELLLLGGIGDQKVDFEAAYARIRSERKTEIADRIDIEVRNYFSDIEIVDEPTIYEHLLLSLRATVITDCGPTAARGTRGPPRAARELVHQAGGAHWALRRPTK